ncbi:MAG: hypothetical protein AAF543_20100 [Pseudomonadota bacterium]
MQNAVRPFIDFYRVVSFSPTHPKKPAFRHLWRSLARGWQAARHYRRLELMSDEELARLGLDRETIGRHAFFGDPPHGRP